MSEPRKRGRTAQLGEFDEALKLSDVKFWTLRLLLMGHTPEQIAAAFKHFYGEDVMAQHIRAWRRTGFTEPSTLKPASVDLTAQE